MHYMAEKDKRFELRLSEAELSALIKLAERDGVSKSYYLANIIRRAAKRRRLWD